MARVREAEISEEDFCLATAMLGGVAEDLRACPGAYPISGDCWQVWGHFVFVRLTTCGCFEWAGSSPQYVRDGVHIKPVDLKRLTDCRSLEELLGKGEKCPPLKSCTRSWEQRRIEGYAGGVNREQGRL